MTDVDRPFWQATVTDRNGGGSVQTKKVPREEWAREAAHKYAAARGWTDFEIAIKHGLKGPRKPKASVRI